MNCAIRLLAFAGHRTAFSKQTSRIAAPLPRWLQKALFILLLFVIPALAIGQPAPQVLDIPTRPGVVQRVINISPAEPKAIVVLFAGGHGGLQITQDGTITWGKGNFLIRSRQLFVDQGLAVAIIDAPSDRQVPPYLQGFRQTAEHVADVRAVIASLRKERALPVWLVGTSRGTQSAAYIATQLPPPVGPDGLVLTATILSDRVGRAVPAMDLNRIGVPVLVVHHEKDACSHCSFADAPALMTKLSSTPRSQLISFSTGVTRGDPCEAYACHGFNGIEAEVVGRISTWILASN